MKITTRIEPINLDIAAILKDDLSPAARREALIDFARDQLADAQETNKRAIGRIPDHETIVDGARAARIEQVKPDGVIVFEFDLLLDLFAWIGEQLVLASPVLTGEYRASHAFFADGVEVEPGAAVPEAEEYVFLSTVPYARKLENGYSDQAPDGVYQVIATLAARRFGNYGKIRFSYRSPISSYVALGGRRGGKLASAETRAAHKREAVTRVPAIVITTR